MQIKKTQKKQNNRNNNTWKVFKKKQKTISTKYRLKDPSDVFTDCCNWKTKQ